MALLPKRVVSRDGRGEGGALSVEELIDVIKPASEKPVLAKRSILCTDSAKAYKRVGFQFWPEAELLKGNFEEKEAFEHLEIAHCNVTHKRKPGENVVRSTLLHL